jgi:quercetin dioxygenase-like cupin family protein
MYLGEPPERHDVAPGGLVHVEAGTVLQIVNHSDEEAVVFVYGAPPERAGADIYDSAVELGARQPEAGFGLRP